MYICDLDDEMIDSSARSEDESEFSSVGDIREEFKTGIFCDSANLLTPH
jgi:hypothetical protein